MATYYTNPNNQRDESAPMFYARDNMSASYTETSVNPGNVMMYMSSGSYSDSLPLNSQQPPESSEVLSAPPHQEMLSVLGGSRLGEHEYNAWREGRNGVLLMESVGAASVGVLEGQNLQGQGLSLSLGTQIPNGIQIPSFPYRNPNQDFGSFMTPDPPVSGEGAFTGGGRDSHSPYGISGNIPGSKYLKAAQQLLDEVVNVRNALKQPDNAERKKSEQLEKCSGENDPFVPLNPQESLTSSAPSKLSHAERQDLQNKLTKLLSLLDEVDRRYKQYYHQMHIVVSSFDAVAGFGATKPYTALALQTISRHFRCLRDAITGQIQAARKGLGEQDTLGSVKGVGISRLRFVDKQLRQQRTIQHLGMMQQHAWRPQRGLPESSVSVLRAWLFEHFLHPYPKDSDKIMLARQTGLSRSQVSNWFINARVRLWKPMVEEMYKEEAEDAEMESNSSSENAGKGTREDIQQSLSSTATERRNRQLLDSKPDNIPEIETAGGDGEAEHRFMAAAYQMPEIGRLGPGTGVSLTLGLQHCDGPNLSPMPIGPHHSFPPLTMRGDEIYSAAGSSVGHEAADFECIDAENQQHRFSSSQLVHDFVA